MNVLVHLNIKSKGLNRPFMYCVDESLRSKVAVGKRVLVPFNNRNVAGFIKAINVHNQHNIVLKPIIKIIDDEAIINDELKGIIDLIEKNTLAMQSKILETVLPKGVQATAKPLQRSTYKIIKLKASAARVQEYLKEQRLGANQRACLSQLLDQGWIKKSDYQPSTYKKLLLDGIIEIDQKLVTYNRDEQMHYPKHDLNAEQLAAYQLIADHFDKATTFLLHGVTGSGKTEIYLHLIEAVIAAGKSAIVLVPEISLTPQIEGRFKGRFKTGVITLHSKMSNQERLAAWHDIRDGQIKVVIGPRSAIFAPLPNLGIIIVDEEHEPSYKQKNNPKYHARDVAIFRSEYNRIPLVLGSATPSLESMARALKGVYHLVKVEQRVNQCMPRVIIIDKNERMKDGAIISRLLIDKIKTRLAKKEQVILFLNRRGYNTVSTCRNCGYVIKCPACDVTLTFHHQNQTNRCHYCGYTEKINNECPSCHHHAMRRTGMGTEKLEQDLLELIPGVKILRMDRDTTRAKNAYYELINTFDREEADILIGTQMISKGLDFKKVTLVGVINADASLNIPDFRSTERAFNLLSQVAGRSGRGNLIGEVVIETFNPNHYVIQATQNHDYMSFYNQEMTMRKALLYPPYFYLCLIKVSGVDEQMVIAAINNVTSLLQENLSKDYIVLGPAPGLPSKINNLYYYQTYIKYKNDALLKKELLSIIKTYEHNKKVNIDVDFNPS